MVSIRIENVSKVYPPARGGAGPTVALDNVSLEVAAGSLYFLLGPSGCGKTTLLRIIAGFTAAAAGRVWFDDVEITAVPPHRRNLGMVFQSYALWPHLTVADNVAFGLDARGIRNPERRQRIGQALAQVQMEHLADRRPNQLSGGQQQRVALARALAIRPRCLLLDEPLSNLDAKLRLDMRGEIRRIVKECGITTLYVTHDQKEALSMADAIALLNAGRIEQTGSPSELYLRPATAFVAGFIGESNFLPGTVERVSDASVVVRTAAGSVLAAMPREGGWLSAGTAVTLAFRPEAVCMVADAGGTMPAKANRLRARRVGTTYLGEIAEHVLALGETNAMQIKAFELNPQSVCASEVVVDIAPESLSILPG